MSKFFGQEFLTAQYFRPNYLHGAGGVPPTQDGKSGYWRLFYYQLQEEALKNEKVVEHTGGVVTSEGVNDAVPSRKKPAKTKKPVPIVQEDFKPEPLPLFKRRPIYEQPSTYEELATLPHESLAVEVQQLQGNIYQFAQYVAAKQKRLRTRRRAAAFLLLAA